MRYGELTQKKRGPRNNSGGLNFSRLGRDFVIPNLLRGFLSDFQLKQAHLSRRERW